MYDFFTEDEKELIEMLNENDDLNHFLLCSPHSTDPVLNYGGILAQKIKKEAFENSLYINGKETVEYEIIRDICSGGKSTIKIIGNKGCGKTTLVHQLRKVLSDKKDIRTLVLDFGESRSTLEFEHAKDAVARTVYRRLVEDSLKNNCNGLKWIIDLYVNIEDSIDIYWDANNQIDALIYTLNGIRNSNSPNKRTLLKEQIRPILYRMELFQLILLFVLCDIYINRDNHRTAVFLDNLDNMIDIKDIKRAFVNYNNFLSGIGKLFQDINSVMDREYGYKYVFIFVLRDSTNTYLSNHELAIKQIAFNEYDVSKHYSKKEIALKRIELFTKYIQTVSTVEESKKTRLLSQAELLSIILRDRYVTDTVFDVFNNDYRICLMTMLKIASSGVLTKEEYQGINQDGSAHGSHGVIYRLLFNSFKKSGYFSRIRIVDFNNRGIKSSSPSRLLLTYIANSTDSRLTHDSRVISFADILDDVDDKISHSDVIRCLWEMYDLATAEDWCNLISFAESDDASENGLSKEWQYYTAIKNNENPSQKVNYSTFRITSAGLAFLTYISVHFEYFACRLYGDNVPPLFLSKSLEKNNDEYYYQKTIDGVFSEVTTCALNLANTYESDNNLCNNDNSDFVFRRPGKNAQYHIERMVFSHVRYLDEFRRFVLKKKPELEAHRVSDFVLQKIYDYLSVFKNYEIKCSKYGKETVLKELWDLYKKAKDNPYDPNIVIGRE